MDMDTPSTAPTQPLERPRFAVEGHEDEVYHERRRGRRGDEPEYCAFFDQSWTFNRTLRWLSTEAGNLICYALGGRLALTGEARASDWFSDPVNEIRHQGGALLFGKRSARQRDAVVVPGLQVNLDQHPVLEVTVTDASAAWQVCVLVKGRSGAPLLASEWLSGPGSVTLDLATAWRRQGYTLRFAELHLALGVWTETPEAPAALTATVSFPGRMAVVPCLPVVRTRATAARAGVPIAAVVVDAAGNLLRRDRIALTAECQGRDVPVEERDGVWSGTLAGAEMGECAVTWNAQGQAAAVLPVRVSDGSFLTYNSSQRSLVRGTQALGPVTGSFAGTIPFRQVGSAGERLIQGQAAWDDWDRSTPPGEHWHYWEALTEAELEQRLAYLAENGWDFIHLCQGWGVWEKLDAGGHLAPHGAEQLALLLRIAARHQLSLLMALSHYPYGTVAAPSRNGYTPVLRQYLEAGFRDEDWKDPSTPFTALFHQYLAEFIALFREETALGAMSTSGEGDHMVGPGRVNDTQGFVTRLDANHIFLCEPIIRLTKLPHELSQGFEPQLKGSRVYWAGLDLYPETDLGIEYKMLQLGDYFMGEGSWPCPPLYATFMGLEETWAGTPRYRIRIRDTFYIGLVHRSPIMLTWDELCTEDEHLILRQARKLVDWSQGFEEPRLAIRVQAANLSDPEQRRVLGQYESWFSARSLMARYLVEDAPAPVGTIVCDARQPYEDPELPAACLAERPLRTSRGYRAYWLRSADHHTLVAYLCNTANHALIESGNKHLAGRWHRKPESVACRIELGPLPTGSHRLCLYDLTTRQALRDGQIEADAQLDLGATAHDFLLVVIPAPASPQSGPAAATRRMGPQGARYS
jgi:hypothetical protein